MHKGFHIRFENGVIASVQWGAGNYCDNHFPEDRDFSFSKDAESNDAEVAAMDINGKFITKKVDPERCPEYDDVIGWLSPEDVLDFLNKCKAYDPSSVKDEDDEGGDNDG